MHELIDRAVRDGWGWVAQFQHTGSNDDFETLELAEAVFQWARWSPPATAGMFAGVLKYSYRPDRFVSRVFWDDFDVPLPVAERVLVAVFDELIDVEDA